MDFNRFKTQFWYAIGRLPMRRQKRWKYYKRAGVDIVGDRCFIGRGVVFDSVYPSYIHLGNSVHITDGVTILTHYLDTSRRGIYWRSGHVYIGDGTFIGTNTIISKDVRIGKNVIIGAGSVVTKDIPDNEIWAGNPAKMIKIRDNF